MFIDNLREELNNSVTENGAQGYSTTGKNIVDFNFKISSYRNLPESEILVDFMKVWFEDKELAIKFLFYIRDVREGVGERRLFRVCIEQIADELDSRVFDWIATYGRYDDIFVFIGTHLENDMIKFVKETLENDMKNVSEQKPITLLAKWMPSINTSSTSTKKLAKYLCRKLEISNATYRKMLATLRSYSNVVEVSICNDKWSEINYESVPSKANLKYKDAFMKHDGKRREKYLEELEKGEVKINSSTAFPHDIVNKYMSDKWDETLRRKDLTLEAMWKALPDYVNGNCNTLVVRDGSGSMTTKVGKTSISCLQVATALSIYFSERLKGQFKDKFITFSSHPELVSFEKYDNLHDKIKLAYSYDDCSNTNIEATFDLILNVAVKNNLKQSEIPNLLIISDMEFDSVMYGNNDEKLFKTTANKFQRYGYKLPRLSFWNVCSRTSTIPVMQNELGVSLVSGFSPALSKQVLSEEIDPYKTLVKQLMSDRYKQVTLK